MVRNTRPYIRAAYPNATIKGKPVAFPDRRLHTVDYDLGATYGGLYDEIVAAIDSPVAGPVQAGSLQEEVGHPRRGAAQVGGRPGGRPGRHLQDPVPQAAGIEHRGVPPEPAAGA